MGLFKKKPSVYLPELPPLPSPPGISSPVGDIPPIRPPEDLSESVHDLPELPPAPGGEELPEPPMPEIPEAPSPEGPEMIEPAPALEPAEEIIERERIRKPIGPAFVSVDDYRAILESSNRVRSKLMESENFLKRLQEIKEEEERTFEKWRSQLEDVERKLGQIDRLIAKAKR
jgi:hypothetical protein